MNKNERAALLIFIFLLALGFLVWNWMAGSHPTPGLTPAPVIPAATPTPPSKPAAPVPAPKPVSLPSALRPATKLKSALPPAASGTGPTPPAIHLHKELIPKDITIVRCYYSQEIAPPGVTFGFDINGSGFNQEFEKMIKVESGAASIDIQNLKLVTANQIHGEMVVQPNAATSFVYPRVLIKGLPVFSAPDPFAVVRKGEVLTIVFISMEETGRAGRFRVITNLDDDLAKQFRVEPSTPGLDISAIEPHLPYAIEGTLRIDQHVPPGEYGLAAFVGSKEVYRRSGMIRIVRPNVGQTGFVQGAMAAERYHRPGDTIQLYLQGSGLTSTDVNQLTAKVDEFDMGPATFSYLSGTQMRAAFNSPTTAPVGSYGVTIADTKGTALFAKKDLFEIVPANWIGGVQLTPMIQPGQTGELRILGRDFSTEFVQGLKIDVDEPGLVVGAPRHVDASTIAASVSVSSTVAPGDYWIHLSAGGKKITPPYGSIIKVQPH